MITGVCFLATIWLVVYLPCRLFYAFFVQGFICEKLRQGRSRQKLPPQYHRDAHAKRAPTFASVIVIDVSAIKKSIHAKK